VNLRVHLLGRLGAYRRDDVVADVQRDRYRRMAQPFADDLRVDPGEQGQGRVSAPKVVKPDPAQWAFSAASIRRGRSTTRSRPDFGVEKWKS
jgi:hypothetical protein